MSPRHTVISPSVVLKLAVSVSVAPWESSGENESIITDTALIESYTSHGQSLVNGYTKIIMQSTHSKSTQKRQEHAYINYS